MPELQSRCTVIDFAPPKGEEKKVMLREALSRILFILNQEKIEHDKRIVLSVLQRFFPDIRKTINFLQTYCRLNGKIDAGILSVSDAKRTETLVGMILDKDWKASRQWVAENSDVDFTLLIGELYQILSAKIPPENVPMLILLLNKYDVQNTQVTNREINTSAMILEIMSDCCV